MRLNALLLADSVTAPPDGKFYVHGGGLTRLIVPGLPFLVPLGALARPEIEEREMGESHEFAFVLIDPNGQQVEGLPHFTAPFPPGTAYDLAPGEQRFVVLALNMTVAVTDSGLYTFDFRVDGVTMGSIPLPVTIVAPVAS
jgi:hypothetical protein